MSRPALRRFPLFGAFPCFVFSILLGILCVGSPAWAESYDWNRWRALPVFHDGRVMPLDTLARQLVKEVCGTERPLVLVDKDLLDKLRQTVDSPQVGEGMETGLAGESGDNFDLVSAQQAAEERNRQMADIHRTISRLPDDTLPGFLPGEEDEDAEENDGGLSEITSLVQDRQRIARRIELLIPKGRRYFEAHELLFSWIVEPEIWDYIPFIPTGNTLFQQEVIGTRPYNRVGYRMNRVCRAHLEQSPAYAKILQDMQQGLVPEADSKRKDFERCVRKIEEALAAFDRIVFRPDRGFPEQCALRLQAAMEGTDRHPQSPFRLMVESLDMLCAIDGRNSTQSGVPEIRGMVRDAMMRMHQLYAPFESHPDFASPLDVRPAAMEALFERMLETLDGLGALSATLMQRAWPEGNYPLPPGTEAADAQWLSGLFDHSFTPERRRYRDHQLLRFHYAVGTLRREVLAAYLALYDNGHAVRIVPSLMEESILTVDHDMYPVSPWVSIQTLLLARGPMLRRFVDSEFRIPSTSGPTPATATPSTSSPVGDSTTEAPGLLDGLDGSGGIGAEPGDGTTSGGSPASSTANSTTTETATENPSDASAASEIAEDAGTVTTMTEPSADSPAPSPEASVADTTNNSTFRIRRALARAYEAYAVNEAITRFKAFGIAMHEFAGAVESTGSRAELVRRHWLDNGKATEELLSKTAYPARGTLAMELWYSRLNPFFWMWVCSALALVFIGLSAFIDRAQKEMIESNPGSAKRTRIEQAMQQELFRRRSWGRLFFRIAALLLGFAIVMTFLGGLMRAWITGWAPVTNMYETVVLMGFAAAMIGLCYTLAPVLKPVFAKAWAWSAFPGPDRLKDVFESLSSRTQATENEAEKPGNIETITDEEILEELGVAPPGYTGSIEPDAIDFADPRRGRRITGLWNLVLAVPRLLLMVAVLYVTLRSCYGEYVAQEGIFGTLGHLFDMHDPVDLAVVFLTILLIVWFVPRLILAVLLTPVVASCGDQLAADAGLLPEEEEESLGADRDQSLSSMVEKSETRRVAGSPRSRYGKLWWDLARAEIGGRKLFLAVGALVALLAGLCAASFSEFNPQIRPLTAVLRSNFWLAAHVIAIIVSYAAAGISWGLSMAALGFYIFGHYRREIGPDGRRVFHVPAPCRMLTPYILQMLRVSVFLLAIGTILGARWADYSWGRFWGWDPKEVWALVTLLYFQVILHGRLARFYGPFGLAVGAALGAIAVVVTWYGANYVFQMGMHAYGGGTNTGGAFAYYVFIAFNALWCFAAALSYYAIRSGTSAGFGGVTETV